MVAVDVDQWYVNFNDGDVTAVVRVLEDNSALRQKLVGKAAPNKEYLQLETADGQRTFRSVNDMIVLLNVMTYSRSIAAGICCDHTSVCSAHYKQVRLSCILK